MNMDDKQKQIEEMVKVIMDAVPETIQYVQAPANETEARIEAKALIAVGYRKQSDTAKEILQYLYEKMGNVLVSDTELVKYLAARYGVEVEE